MKWTIILIIKVYNCSFKYFILVYSNCNDFWNLQRNVIRTSLFCCTTNRNKCTRSTSRLYLASSFGLLLLEDRKNAMTGQGGRWSWTARGCLCVGGNWGVTPFSTIADDTLWRYKGSTLRCNIKVHSVIECFITISWKKLTI